MERLTFEGNFCDIARCESTPGGSYCESGSCSQREVWERLKAYEDTGLMPESVEALKVSMMGETVSEITEFDGLPIDRLKELAKADKEGRLVVLPCKVGDTVYVNGARRTVQASIDGCYIYDVNRPEYRVSFRCDSDCDDCPFAAWRQFYDGEYACDSEYGQASIMGGDFGKTVFLSREEAEEALRGGEDE